jgi:hypothetical protein
MLKNIPDSKGDLNKTVKLVVQFDFKWYALKYTELLQKENGRKRRRLWKIRDSVRRNELAERRPRQRGIINIFAEPLGGTNCNNISPF